MHTAGYGSWVHTPNGSGKLEKMRTTHRIGIRQGLGTAPKSIEKHIKELTKSLARFGELLVEGIKVADEAEDPVTVDSLTSTCRATDKTLWFVESHQNHRPE